MKTRQKKKQPATPTKEEKKAQRARIQWIRTTGSSQSNRLKRVLEGVSEAELNALNLPHHLSPKRFKVKGTKIYTPDGTRIVDESPIDGIPILTPADSPVKLHKPETYSMIYDALIDGFQPEFARIDIEGSEQRPTILKHQLARHSPREVGELDSAGKTLRGFRRRRAAKQQFGYQSANLIVVGHDVPDANYEFNHLISDAHLSYLAACVVDRIIEQQINDAISIQRIIAKYYPSEAQQTEIDSRYKQILKALSEGQPSDSLIQKMTNVLSADIKNLCIDTQAHNTGTIPIEQLVLILIDPELAEPEQRKFLFPDKPNLVIETDVSAVCDAETHIDIKHRYIVRIYLQGALEQDADISLSFNLLPLVTARTPRDLTETVFDIYQEVWQQYQSKKEPVSYEPKSLADSIREANLATARSTLFTTPTVKAEDDDDDESESLLMGGCPH